MTPKSRPASVLALLCLSCLFAANASAQTDNQLWTDVQLAVPVTKRIDFNILGTLRVGRDITRPVDERVGAGFTLRLGKYLSLSPNYTHIATQPVAPRRSWENRLSFPVQVRFNVGDFRVTNRNLLERRLRSSGVTSSRYRNRFQLDHPIGAKDWQLSVFVADEVFYDWTVDRWVRNRFSAGATKVFNQHFTQDLYYLRQNDSFTVPGDLHVIGTALRFRL